ncbi:hypothetical protein NIES806_29480 [Dolichospermum compactum NIES-806]|uniref:Uncharacterized protein n=1 Tax=Dolichospermum compactum NIES-806 TaxID=1973481 RepID=A0A1Z4V5D8_9CYAN|nr:hypothetical protein NIES806_29480 [Dolichospermum compactum NIES-806]
MSYSYLLDTNILSDFINVREFSRVPNLKVENWLKSD